MIFVKLFLDTANVDEIREINSWGVLDGVTTNPTLVAREGRDFKQVVKEICTIVDGPVSAEVISTDAPGMLREAQDISAWHKNVVVKMPCTEEGLKALSLASKKGIKVNMTLVFSSNQALLAAKAGAYFVSPFVGRLDDVSEDGLQVIRDSAQIFEKYSLKAQVLSSSIRHPLHVLESAKAGAHACTLPFKVFKQLIAHPLTDAGVKRFLDDWNAAKIPQK